MNLATTFLGSGAKGGFRVTRTGPWRDSGRCWRMFIEYVLWVSLSNDNLTKAYRAIVSTSDVVVSGSADGFVVDVR